MRVYTFSHFMLSSIQQGIQAGHAITELFNKYSRYDLDDLLFHTTKSQKLNAECAGMLYEWSENHKTHIALNGGNSLGLANLVEEFLDKDNDYPWVTFNEDEDSLDSLMTSIAIVLPEKIYETVSLIKQNKLEMTSYGFVLRDIDEDISEEEILDIEEKFDKWKFTDFDKWLIENLGTFRLAQ